MDEIKTIQKHFSSIPLAEMLQWATMNGARALQMESSVGSFEKGKKPGVVLIEGVESGLVVKNSTVKRILS